MFRAIRDLPRVLQGLIAILSDLIGALQGVSVQSEGSRAVQDRLEALERSRDQWEGKIEAELLKADARFAAARAAEERTRHMARRVKGEDDDAEEGAEAGDEAIAAYVRAMAERDGEGGNAEGVHPVPGRVATRAETREALRAHKLQR